MKVDVSQRFSLLIEVNQQSWEEPLILWDFLLSRDFRLELFSSGEERLVGRHSQETIMRCKSHLVADWDRRKDSIWTAPLPRVRHSNRREFLNENDNAFHARVYLLTYHHATVVETIEWIVGARITSPVDFRIECEISRRRSSRWWCPDGTLNLCRWHPKRWSVGGRGHVCRAVVLEWAERCPRECRRDFRTDWFEFDLDKDSKRLEPTAPPLDKPF